ncbi:MAG: 2-(R)-hydroxypropyl-CoM dehydrogenase, partial [Verrucomicrobiota bacterium]
MRVLVTGSSTGIGRALALRLLDAGHAVWGWARSDQTELAAARPTFRASRADVADWPAVRAAAAEIATAWGGLDALVTCAGVQGEIGRALAADPARWSATVRANLDGTYFALRACAPLLERAERRAKVVCFSGGGATKPRPNFSAYGAAKTAVVRLVETIATEEQGRPRNASVPGIRPRSRARWTASNGCSRRAATASAAGSSLPRGTPGPICGPRTSRAGRPTPCAGWSRPAPETPAPTRTRSRGPWRRRARRQRRRRKGKASSIEVAQAEAVKPHQFAGGRRRRDLGP